MTPGYAFVPLPDRVRRLQRDEARHDRIVPGTLSGALRCAWLTEQPVHVGSGFKARVGERVVREGIRVHGRPGIPGSSLKGVLRARYEAITYSCAQSPGNHKHSLRSSSYENYRGRIDRCATDLDVFTPCRRDLCPACALFGTTSRRGRIVAGDLAAPATCGFTILRMPKQFSPNLHHLGKFKEHKEQHLLVVHKLHGRKFAVSPAPERTSEKYTNVEAIPAGTRLEGSVGFINLTPQELGGLLVALGRHDIAATAPIKLGGGKCHAFGRLRLESLELIERRTPAREFTRSPAPRFDAWLAAFRSAEDCYLTGLTRLLEIHGREC